MITGQHVLTVGGHRGKYGLEQGTGGGLIGLHAGIGLYEGVELHAGITGLGKY
jgi:hypothetical protein